MNSVSRIFYFADKRLVVTTGHTNTLIGTVLKYAVLPCVHCKGRFVQRRSRQNKPLFIETVELAGGVIVHEFRGDAPGELTLGEVSTVEVIRPAHAGQREEEVHRRWTEREQRLRVGQSLNGRRVLRPTSFDGR